MDWNDVWKERIKLNSKLRGGIDCVKFWSSKKSAEKYWEVSKENKKELSVIKSLKLKPHYSVLDIGAGPGNLAIPISRLCKSVTAIEPSPAMFAVLEQNIKTTGVKNIKTIHKRWENAGKTGRHDIVLASFCFGMEDIKSALLKMDEAAKKAIHLFWFAEVPGWNRRVQELRKLWGRPKLPGNPKADVLFNVLLQIGIFPNVEIKRNKTVREFADVDAAVKFFTEREKIKTKRELDIARDFVRQTVPFTNGRYIMKDTYKYAHIWWRKNEE